jgi:hypothetical protein
MTRQPKVQANVLRRFEGAVLVVYRRFVEKGEADPPPKKVLQWLRTASTKEHAEIAEFIVSEYAPSSVEKMIRSYTALFRDLRSVVTSPTQPNLINLVRMELDRDEKSLDETDFELALRTDAIVNRARGAEGPVTFYGWSKGGGEGETFGEPIDMDIARILALYGHIPPVSVDESYHLRAARRGQPSIIDVWG